MICVECTLAPSVPAGKTRQHTGVQVGYVQVADRAVCRESGVHFIR